MNRINFGRMSGTVVDVCRAHGTFLDPGELHQIVDFIAEGGLDRAREAEIRGARGRAATARSRPARDRPGHRTQGMSSSTRVTTVDATAVHELLRALFER